ncbi:MAG: hypothetical protein JSV04_13505 [Candidatus Heimdallarchaeota archaeon]|nr:MAG: hypothetical protein JSV04_13505 [Candidatus Heimdallarchaeota archaeon]
MENPLRSVLNKQNLVVQLYGLPGTYKTTFLVQLIRKKLEEGVYNIFLIDTSSNFPIVRLKSIKHLLQNLVVFQPKTLEEEALLLDDLNIQLLSPDSVLLIDDVFRHTDLKDQGKFHLNSYILALIKIISKTVNFPIIITNQARSFDNSIRPFLQSLTLQYIDWHFLFEKIRDPHKILVSFFDRDGYVSQIEQTIDSSGFFTAI